MASRRVDYPAVGDWVAIQIELKQDCGVICKAISFGVLDARRFQNNVELKRDLAFLARKDDLPAQAVEKAK